MKIRRNGKSAQFNDRELAGEVRGMGLLHLKKILSDDYKDKDFQKQILVRLAASLLPRLNEHTGEGGKPIEMKFDNAFQDATFATPKTNRE